MNTVKGLATSSSAKGMEDVSARERGNCLESACLARAILDHVFSRWGALVLWSLVGGRRRYSEIRETVDGVSEKMLAQTLRTLERDGLVLRESYPVVPPRVEYELTPLGERCVAHVRELVFFIEENVLQFVAAHDTFDGSDRYRRVGGRTD